VLRALMRFLGQASLPVGVVVHTAHNVVFKPGGLGTGREYSSYWDNKCNFSKIAVEWCANRTKCLLDQEYFFAARGLGSRNGA
jgi:hypothetical protein